MSGLPREILKWLQSLDLAWQIKIPKWDLTNGYLVAEIFSWYFNQEICMHSFYNRNSLELKERNWYLIKNFIKSKQFDIPEEFVEGTIHCKEGAASKLVERLYEILTNRKLKAKTMETDYTDYAYQVQLPMLARSTATLAIKNNLRLTETKADVSLIHNAQKCQKIINDHIDHRRLERMQDPDRFGIKPTIGERCVRHVMPGTQSGEETPEDVKSVDTKKDPMSGGFGTREQSEVSLPFTRSPTVHFKEIQVQQMDKSNFYNMPIHGF